MVEGQGQGQGQVMVAPEQEKQEARLLALDLFQLELAQACVRCQGRLYSLMIPTTTSLK